MLFDWFTEFWRALSGVFSPIPQYVYDESVAHHRKGEVLCVQQDYTRVIPDFLYPTFYKVLWEDGEVELIETYRFVWAGNRWVRFS